MSTASPPTVAFLGGGVHEALTVEALGPGGSEEIPVGKHLLAIDGKDYEVSVGSRDGERVQVTVNGTSYVIEVKAQEGAAEAPLPVHTPHRPAPTAPPPPMPGASAPAAGEGQVAAPMAGMVLSIKVGLGQQVEVGTELVVLEAMKMENKINAPVAGTVQSIAVQAQQTVNQGQLLLTIA